MDVKEWIYNFISSGEINKDQLSKADVTDPDLLDLIDKRQQTLQHCWTSLKEWWLVEGSNSTENRGEDDDEQGDKMGDYTSGDEQQEKITVSSFMQCLTGQGHIPISSTQREKFKIHVEFNHDCQLQYGQQRLCCPLVNACSCTVTLPTQHLGNYKEFLCIM
ncbi:Phosphopentomutase [Labeo rohita]|uniref:Phosphopentomutase n=1 Tax=Labeo rohita TaxID=84645 RepID=A0ABQ8MV68_LABRO|nr:Phosphopentomutase [Labeo rohita]